MLLIMGQISLFNPESKDQNFTRVYIDLHLYTPNHLIHKPFLKIQESIFNSILTSRKFQNVTSRIESLNYFMSLTCIPSDFMYL